MITALFPMMSLPAVLVAVRPAAAWSHTGWLWDLDECPVEWWMSDYEQEQLGWDYQAQALEDGFQNWVEEVPCAHTCAAYMGIREGHHNSGLAADGKPTIYYDDPTQYNKEGALGVTYPMMFGAATSVGGNNYYFAEDIDIVFSDNVSWARTDDIESGACSNKYSIEGVATHEIGHLWGMDHSCDSDPSYNPAVGESDWPCNDPDKLGAIMYYQGSSCSTDQLTATDDDIDGMLALYSGLSVAIDSSAETPRFGGVPLEVCFELLLESDDPSALDVTWRFGDEASGHDHSDPDDPSYMHALAPCHEYQEKGQYTVSVEVSGTDEECGGYSVDDSELAYVIACERPQPAPDFDGLFTFEHVDGLIYQMINQTDTSVYGCIDGIQWDVFKEGGDEAVGSVNAWSPKLDFEKYGGEGTYRVVLNISGPGVADGEPPVAEELTIDVVDKPGEDATGCGCATAPSAAGAFSVVGCVAALARRRRRNG